MPCTNNEEVLFEVMVGSKLRATQIIVYGNFGKHIKLGDVVEVTDVRESLVFVKTPEGNTVSFTLKALNLCFEPIVKNTVTQKDIEAIMNHSKVTVRTEFGKCTIVTCQLPNGFVLVESSACIDPSNYNEKMGVDICMKKIINRVWELEGYRLQSELYTKKA